MRAYRLGVLGIAAAVATGSPAGARSNLEGEIQAVSKTFDDAQFRHDVKGLDHLLAADFKFVRGSGKLTDRADFIRGFADAEVKFEPFVITNRIFVPLAPDAGIVGGEGIIRGTDHGQAFEEHFRYADTFRRRGSGWEVAYVQVTPLK